MGSLHKHRGEVALEELSDDAVRSFATRFHGDVLRPPDEEYDEARRVWNGMIEKYPALVARCADVPDVVAAVTFARDHELPLAVRGGG
ncbi:FAD-linked oxidase, partial [Natrinema soli]